MSQTNYALLQRTILLLKRAITTPIFLKAWFFTLQMSGKQTMNAILEDIVKSM